MGHQIIVFEKGDPPWLFILDIMVKSECFIKSVVLLDWLSVGQEIAIDSKWFVESTQFKNVTN